MKDFELKLKQVIISELSNEDIGKPLLYIDKFSNEFCILVGFNDKYIFIAYNSKTDGLMSDAKGYYFTTVKKL